MQKIGVFVCWCGSNIAGTVDVHAVAEAMKNVPGVVYATDYQYMCSEVGQQKIREAIAEYGLTGVVVCSCSPRMHEATFRKTAEKAGLNPYMVEIANIREQCSWIHKDKDRRHPDRAGHRRRGLRGGHRGKIAHHRRPHGATGQDLPDPGLRGLHPHPEDGGRRPEREDRHHLLRRGRKSLRLRGQLHRHHPQKGALCGHHQVHRLRRVHGEMPLPQGQERVQHGPEHAHGHLYPVRAGHSQRRLHRSRAVHQTQDRQVRPVRKGLHRGRHRLQAAG